MILLLHQIEFCKKSGHFNFELYLRICELKKQKP
jgi:hypothetical protein